MPQKLNRDTFIEKSNKKHNHKYDYSLVQYINAKTKVVIKCPEHGNFEQTPDKHYKGGCFKCAIDYRASLKINKAKNEFVKKAKIIHGDKYNYDKVVYINSNLKVVIICPVHGSFLVAPCGHLSGYECKKCSYEKSFYTTKEFIEKSIKVHFDRYDYSKCDYFKHDFPVNITCKKHGVFSQTPVSHLSGKGCSKCNKSKIEILIERFLLLNNIKFKEQKTFDSCINPLTNYKLKFDFYLPKFNLLLEYDGQQHSRANSFWNEISKDKNILQKRQYLDNLKDEWCSKNNIKLFRISYKYRRTILKRLENFLKINFNITNLSLLK